MTRPALVRRSLAAAVLPLALGSLSACGGSDDGASAADPSSTSSSSAAPGGPEAGSTVAPADFVDRFRGAFDDVTTAHTTVKTRLMGQSITGEGDLDYTGDSPAATMTMSGGAFGSGGLEVRLVDNVMYMNLGPMTQGKFVKLDLDDPTNPMGESMAQNMDPSRAMDALESALQKVTYVGADDNGDHYAVTVDTGAMLKGMGQDVPDSAQVPGTMSYDVWFDGEGRFSRMVMDMGSMGTTEMTLSDYGTDVQIEAPPADQVTSHGLRMAG